MNKEREERRDNKMVRRKRTADETKIEKKCEDTKSL